jgi:hypothetical protein
MPFGHLLRCCCCCCSDMGKKIWGGRIPNWKARTLFFSQFGAARNSVAPPCCYLLEHQSIKYPNNPMLGASNGVEFAPWFAAKMIWFARTNRTRCDANRGRRGPSVRNGGRRRRRARGRADGTGRAPSPCAVVPAPRRRRFLAIRWERQGGKPHCGLRPGVWSSSWRPRLVRQSIVGISSNT